MTVLLIMMSMSVALVSNSQTAICAKGNSICIPKVRSNNKILFYKVFC